MPCPVLAESLCSPLWSWCFQPSWYALNLLTNLWIGSQSLVVFWALTSNDLVRSSDSSRTALTVHLHPCSSALQSRLLQVQSKNGLGTFPVSTVRALPQTPILLPSRLTWMSHSTCRHIQRRWNSKQTSTSRGGSHGEESCVHVKAESAQIFPRP